MTIEFGLCDTGVNTQYAPLIALAAHYQSHETLQPLQKVSLLTKQYDFSLSDKLKQVLWSMLAGCETLSEVNSKLRPEVGLARLSGWPHLADQSTLSRTLDQLSLLQIEQLRLATTQIWQSFSQIPQHNWHGFLWLEYDFSGLPCSPRAEASHKGFFSGKKTPPDASWPAPVRSNTVKPSGPTFSRVTTTPFMDCGRPSWGVKLH